MARQLHPIESWISDGRLRAPRDTLIPCLSSNTLASKCGCQCSPTATLAATRIVSSRLHFLTPLPVNNSSCFEDIEKPRLGASLKRYTN